MRYLLAAAMVLLACSVYASNAPLIRLKPIQGSMMVECESALLPGQVFVLGFPETIGCRETILLNWVEVKDQIQWTGPDADGVVHCTWWPGGRVRYDLRLVPRRDYVDADMRITNDTLWTWHDVYSFNCVSPERMPAFKDTGMQKTWLSSSGKPVTVAQARRTAGERAAYLAPDVKPEDARYFIFGRGAEANLRTDGNWMAAESTPEGYVLGTGAPHVKYLFNNEHLSCLHACTDFGTIGPGQTARMVSRVYLMRGRLADFLNRWRADVPRLAGWSMPARMESERVAIWPVDISQAPERAEGMADGQDLARLAVNIAAPGMQGSLQLRLPEVLRSSMGMHFIDHYIASLPPISSVKRLPTWSQDRRTGALRYTLTLPEGVVLQATVTPGVDHVLLQLKVQNRTGQTLRWIEANPCFDLGGSPEFGRPWDLTRLFADWNGALRTMDQTTPTPEQMGRDPWLLFLSAKHAQEWRGGSTSPTWWLVDQRLDTNLMAARSADGELMVGYAWEGETPLHLMSNCGNPCLHTGPAVLPELKPGASHTWRGHIWFTRSGPEALRALYQRDCAGVPAP